LLPGYSHLLYPSTPPPGSLCSSKACKEDTHAHTSSHHQPKHVLSLLRSDQCAHYLACTNGGALAAPRTLDSGLRKQRQILQKGSACAAQESTLYSLLWQTTGMPRDTCIQVREQQTGTWHDMHSTKAFGATYASRRTCTEIQLDGETSSSCAIRTQDPHDKARKAMQCCLLLQHVTPSSPQV
jgi:hypothetical protein